MGLIISRIHFKEGLPSIEKIKKQFKKQTGLNLWIKANVNLLELPLNNTEAIKILNQDIDKYQNFRNQDFNNWEKEQEESKKINYIANFEFSNSRFYEIDFKIDRTTIIMQYGVGQFYFPSSIEKSLYDLGGKFENLNGEVIEDRNPPEHWKKLKYWQEYKWYNRPSSRKYCKPIHKRISNKISRMALEAEHYINEKLNIKQ